MVSSPVLARVGKILPVVQLAVAFRGYSYESGSSVCEASARVPAYYVYFMSARGVVPLTDDFCCLLLCLRLMAVRGIFAVIFLKVLFVVVLLIAVLALVI